MLRRLALSKTIIPRLQPCCFLSSEPPPKSTQHDYIGPPDKLSNLRPIIRHEKETETKLQHALRTKQNDVQEWNQKFWTNHNKRFFDEKDAFIAANKSMSNDVLSADKMSQFYKDFLDKNWKLHFYYNISWYLKNSDLLLLSFQVNIQKLYKKVRN